MVWHTERITNFEMRNFSWVRANPCTRRCLESTGNTIFSNSFRTTSLKSIISTSQGCLRKSLGDTFDVRSFLRSENVQVKQRKPDGLEVAAHRNPPHLCTLPTMQTMNPRTFSTFRDVFYRYLSFSIWHF